MSLRVGVMRGVFSMGGTRLLSALMGAGAILILARLLTPEDFGIVAIATAILTVVQSCTDLSLSNALIQKEKVEETHVHTAWTMALIRSLVLCIFFGLAAWPLSVIYSNPDLIPVFLVSGATGAMIGLQNPNVWLVTKKMSFGPVALVQFLQKAVGVIAAIILAFLLKSYWAIILGYAVGAVVSTATSYVILPYRPRISLKYVREIWAFSGWMFFNQILETLNWRIDQLIIGLEVPKGQLGLYAMADNLAVIPTRETILPIRLALFSGLANLTQNVSKMAQSQLLAQSSIAMLVAPLGFGLALVADPFVRIALGDQWTASIPFVEICAIYYALGTFSMSIQPVAMALAKTKLLFFRQVIAVFIKIPLIVIGLFSGGLIGAALGRLASEFLTVMVEFLFLRHMLNLSLGQQLRQHGLTICGLSAMALAIYLVGMPLAETAFGPAIELIAKIMIGGTAYFATIYLAWLAFGRPAGPVTELFRALAGISARLKNRRDSGLSRESTENGL